MSEQTTMIEKKVFGYYPGCELRNRARTLDLPARRACEVLGITLQEMEDWTCCGSLVPQIKDDYMGFLAPARIFVEAYAQGFDELVTLCAFCFNTLKRASVFLRSHADLRQRVAAFLDAEEIPQIRVIHLMEVLRDQVGFDRLRDAVKRPLDGLRVAPYYGCLLLRPAREMDLDDPNDPTLMEELLGALGCDVVDFSSKTDCCGSYHIVTNPDNVARCADPILHAAAVSRAELLVASCPVCQFNLDWRQDGRTNVQIPVVYFPQLLALALGESVETLGFPDQAANALSAMASAR